MTMIIRLILVLVILVLVYVNGYSISNRYSNSISSNINTMKRLQYNKHSLLNNHYNNYNNALIRSRLMKPLSFKVAEDEEVDEDDEIIEFDDDDGHKGNALISKLSKGVVPLAASLGFALTPSTALSIRIAGAAVGGAAGLLARKTIIEPMLKSSNDDNNNGCLI